MLIERVESSKRLEEGLLRELLGHTGVLYQTRNQTEDRTLISLEQPGVGVLPAQQGVANQLVVGHRHDSLSRPGPSTWDTV